TGCRVSAAARGRGRRGCGSSFGSHQLLEQPSGLVQPVVGHGPPERLVGAFPVHGVLPGGLGGSVRVRGRGERVTLAPAAVPRLENRMDPVVVAAPADGGGHRVASHSVRARARAARASTDAPNRPIRSSSPSGEVIGSGSCSASRARSPTGSSRCSCASRYCANVAVMAGSPPLGGSPTGTYRGPTLTHGGA